MTENALIASLQAVILDELETTIPTSIARQQHIEHVPKKASIIIGVRRCGKSTYLYQIMQNLLKNGISRENILYLNFFDDRLHQLQYSDLNIIMEAYFGLYPDKKNTETIYLFFDELQMVTNWEPFVERVMRTEKCQVYISGSSAQMLSKEIATQMRGRALSWEMFPFSFKEYLNFHQTDYQEPLSTKKRLLIEKAFQGFWKQGGFPEALGLDQRLRVKIHQDYYQAILFRDLIERHDIAHPRALMDLTHKLIDNIASLYSINSLAGYLKSLGHKLAKSHISDYLAWLEDSYFLFTISIFDASITRRKTNPKKIYCIDHAFIKSIAAGTLVNSGHLLENMVFNALRRQFTNIYYYKTTTNREVDFIVEKDKQCYMLIQVCESLQNPDTKQRELKALKDAMAEQNLSTSTIVTRNESETIAVPNGEIQVIPAWRFLLMYC